MAVAATGVFGLVTASLDAQSSMRVGPVPFGWYSVGAQTGQYAVGTDLSRRSGGEGQGGATIRALTERPPSLATLQQSIQAAQFRGHRVRLSGFLKTGPVGSEGQIFNSAAALWMRVDGPASESADYMRDRPIRQGTGWTFYEVVLDVPRDAVGISFGVLLQGPGQVWLDDVVLERVGYDVPLTGRIKVVAVGDALRRRTQGVAYQLAPNRPVNLSFNEGTGSY